MTGTSRREASARTHGDTDDDMIHAPPHHWSAFETDNPAVTMFIGPSNNGDPLEVGVVTDDDGTGGAPRRDGGAGVTASSL